MDRIQLDDKGRLDELVFQNSLFHMERMSGGTFFISVTDREGLTHRFWFTATKSRLDLTLTESDAPTPPKGEA